MRLTLIGGNPRGAAPFRRLHPKGIRVALRIIVTALASAPASSTGKSDNGGQWRREAQSVLSITCMFSI